MTLPFKFLSYEILNNPKPFPICIYPLYLNEFFIPKPTEKSATPSKHVTIIYACLGTYDHITHKPQTTSQIKNKK